MTTSDDMDDFRRKVDRHHEARIARGGAVVSAEMLPPIGQAADWYWHLVQEHPPRSARLTARQLARLCGHDSRVTVPWRSLADAVGQEDAAGRKVAYVQTGVQWLVDAGWLSKDVQGRRRSARTTFSLEVRGSVLGLLPVDREGAAA